MKEILKENLQGIITILILLIVSLCILWVNTIKIYGSQVQSYKTNNSTTYETLDKFTEQSSNTVYLCEVLASKDNYAVCLASSYNTNMINKYYILSKTNNGEWRVLTENYDYKLKHYFNMNINPEIDYIDTYKIKNSNTIIIVPQVVVLSKKDGEYVFNESDIKLRSISDSQNTIFCYKAIPHKNIEMLYVYYVGFVNNFDEKKYILNINNKEYQYSNWKKLMRPKLTSN